MIADKHPLGKFEFRITQKGNIMSNAPFNNSINIQGSAGALRGTQETFQYAESTVASNRSPIPIPREDVYNVEVYDEYPLAGLSNIEVNIQGSASTFIDIKGIEEFLKSGRATALNEFICIVSSVLLPVPTERIIDMLIDNNISCLNLTISGNLAGNSFGAVGSMANVADIPLIETINIASCCTQFPNLLPAKHTLKSVTLGSPNVNSAYQMTGEIGDLRELYRLEKFALTHFNGAKHQYYLPVTLTEYDMRQVYNNQNLPHNWLNLTNLKVLFCLGFAGEFSNSSEAISIDHLTALENLNFIGNSKFYLETDSILADTVTRVYMDRSAQFTMPRISIPDLDKPNISIILIRGYGYSYNTANRCKVTPNLTWSRNETPQADLDQILKDFLTDIVAGLKIAGTKQLSISVSHTNAILMEYPTNDITETAILNGGTDYTVGDMLTTPVIGSGAIIQVVGGTNPNPSSLTNSGANLSIINSGSGYSVNNYLRVIRVSNNGNSGIVRVTSVDGFGGITGLAVTAGGGFYSRNIDYDLLSGTQAIVEVTAVDGSGKITGITTDNGGSDFHEDQTVWTGGTGTGASLRGRTDVRRIVQYGYTVTY